ncbi:YybS family protein [Halobacillus yeomjeoni]|uniref:YybS family protein n=1 Tax=Halobacillus yeomjeoni TaxID=311194 RepID=A0A931HVJ6_9BACI|nr:YybS family protein [Halobacillus yeomjeoni]MBH0230275.1 YybS family protein [Halobacillus yeomjeoni]
MNNTKRITEGALMTGVYLLLLLVIIFMLGIIGSLLLFVLPVPFIFYTYRHGWKSGALMFIASLIFTMLFATVVSLPITLLAGVGGISLGQAMYKERSSYETWAIGSVGFIIGIVGIYLITQLFFGISWADQVRESLNQAFTMTESMFSGMLDQENAEEQLQMVREQLNVLPDIIPSVLAITGIVYAFISQWLTYKLVNRIEQTQFKFSPFREMQLPTSILWYYFFSLILNYIVSSENGMVYLAAINVFTLTGILLVLQGFSFIVFYAQVKKWSKAIPIVVIVLSLLLPQILLYLVRILGIIDIGFSLRQRVEEKK